LTRTLQGDLGWKAVRHTGQPAGVRSTDELPTFSWVTLAYETYGEFAPDRDKAVFVFHALTRCQHAAGHNPSVPESETTGPANTRSDSGTDSSAQAKH